MTLQPDVILQKEQMAADCRPKMIALLLVCSIGGIGASDKGPSLLLSRPLTVSDRTQPLPLLRENVEDIAISLPRPKDLNRNKLRRRLQSEFDPRWMSVDAPLPDGASEVEPKQGRSEAPAWLLNELRNLNLSHPSNNIASLPATRDALEQWLLERASCPVRYDWMDVGPLFWPQWVKQGTCVLRQCSWPSGMTCVPGETNTITLLRWHCMSVSPAEENDRSSSRRKNKCRWLKVPYPVISECVCTCDLET